jgi:Fe-S cluster assembly iron-binding protein IscA
MSDPPTVQITDQARKRLPALFVTDGQRPTIRAYITGHGWRGPRWDLVLDEPKDTDKVVDDPTFQLIVEQALLDRYSDLTVDWRQTSWYEGFSIRCAKPRPGAC